MQFDYLTFPGTCAIINTSKERQVLGMYYVVWKYISEKEAHGSMVTSRDLWFMRLDATVEVLSVEVK